MGSNFGQPSVASSIALTETIESDNIIEHSSYYVQRFLFVHDRYIYYYLLSTQHTLVLLDNILAIL